MASVHTHKKSEYWQANIKAWDARRGWIRAMRSTGVPITASKAKAQLVADKLEMAAADLGPDSPVRSVREHFQRLVDDLCMLAGVQESVQAITWSRWRKAWEGEQHVTAQTLNSYRTGLDLFEQFYQRGDGPLKDLSFDVVGSYYKWLQKQELSPATIKLRWDTLSRCLSRAQKLGYIEKNPCTLVRRDKRMVDEHEREPFTLDEVRRLLFLAQGEWRTACLFGYLYGMRLGDATSRKWSDIRGDELVFTQAKKRGRAIRLPIVDALREHLEALPRESEYLTPHLASITQTSQQKAFRKLMERANVSIKYIPGSGRGTGRRSKSFHSWRHTNKTMLIAAGVSERVADLINDHEDATVSKRYTHAEVETMALALAKLPSVAA